MGEPVNYSDFTTEKLSATPIKTTPKGARVVWMNYDNGPFFLQTPFNLRLPMGISKWENENQSPSYEVMMSLSGNEGQKFAEKLEEIDDWTKNMAIQNSRPWLKKNVDNMVVIDTLYNPTIRYARDKETNEITNKYPPSFRAKIPMMNGVPACEAYEMVNGSPVMVDIMKLMERKSLKGALATAIVKCSGIWFPQKFGISWQVMQIMIEPNSSELKPCAFLGLENRLGARCSAPVQESLATYDDDEIEDNLE